MASQGFSARLAPAREPHQLGATTTSSVLARAFCGPQGFILVGAAALQLAACIVMPTIGAILPSSLLLIGYMVATLSSPSSGPWVEHLLKGRSTAQLPSKAGLYGPAAASQGLVVFNLGVQWNHRLGFLCPGGRQLGAHFAAINEDLMRRRDELGLVSINHWQGTQTENANSFLFTYYFREIESLRRFASEELHRKAWDWYNSERSGRAMGIFHETFVIPAGSYESIYVNCSPICLGRGTVCCRDVEGENQWLNTLVSAETPALRTQLGRFGRGPGR